MTRFSTNINLVCVFASLIYASGVTAVSDGEAQHLRLEKQPSRAAIHGQPAIDPAVNKKYPEWPSSYSAKFKFYVPFLDTYQDGPLKYTMQFWRDTKAGKQRIERDTSEIWIEDISKDRRFYVAPGNNSQDGCLCEHMSEGGGPTLQSVASLASDLLSPALPPITAPQWEYEGEESIDHGEGTAPADVWHYSVVHDKGYGTVRTDWRMYVGRSGEPLRLDMWGENWFTGGHWDHYIAEFYAFIPHPQLPDSMFATPEVCDGVKPLPPDLLPHMGGHHLTARLQRATLGLLPAMLRQGRHDGEYNRHSVRYGRTHAHAAEYSARRHQYYRSKEFVVKENAGGSRSYSLGLNQFADWLEGEFEAANKAKHIEKESKSTGRGGVQALTHEPSLPLHMLPSTVDWRGTAADSIIKDQAMCGSCWAFASVSPMETAYYREYGELTLLSEQYLMDCSWPFGNTGCNGGFQDKAMQFVVQNGGIPSNKDYPYFGVNRECQTDTPLTAAFSGYVEVKPYQPDHLKEALLTKGPMTVSLDADDPGFKFYRSGIFYSENCTTSPPDKLDHAVMISGYGRDPATGQKYWILKNIWSTYWGEGGYMRMDMDRNDCGVTAQPEYMKLDAAQTHRFRQAQGIA